MESEGPYKTEEFGELWTVRGPCGNMPFANEEDADFYRININAAYAEGRKSMEKEIEELLEFVNRIMGFFRRHTYCPSCKSDIDHTFECEVENAADSVLINFSRKCIDDFYVWKNARGIE